MVHKIIASILFFFVLQPAFSNIYEFDFLACRINLNYSDSASLSIGVIDRRTSVSSAERKPEFVGIVRGGYGNPFYAVTKSGKPFAEDINLLLSNTYAAKGYKIKNANVKYDDARETVISKLNATNCKYNLLLVINEWKTDRVMSFATNWVDVYYDLELLVLDSVGNTMLSKKIAGKKPVNDKNAKMVTTKKFIESQALNAFSYYIGSLLNDEDVMLIFKGDTLDKENKTDTGGRDSSVAD